MSPQPMIRCICVVLTLGWTAYIYAESGPQRDNKDGWHDHFIHFDTYDGLSNTWISDIHQSHDGFIWIATQYGLNRYDGVSFDSYVYSSDDTHSISNNWIKNITEDEDGTLWLGSFGNGLNAYDPTTKSIMRHYDEPQDSCHYRFVDHLVLHQDQLWLVGNARVNGQLSDCANVRRLPRATKHVMSHGPYLYAIYDDTIYTYTNADQQPIHQFAASGAQVCAAHDQDIYWAQNLQLYHGTISSSGEIIDVRSLVNLPSQSNCMIATADHIIIGSDQGLYIIDQSSHDIQHIVHQIDRQTSIIDGAILSMELDRENNLWVGGREGLCMIPHQIPAMSSQHYHPSIAQENGVYQTVSIPDGVIVGGPKSIHLYRHDGTPPITIETSIGVRSLLATRDQRTIYIGGWDHMSSPRYGGVWQLDVSSLTITQAPIQLEQPAIRPRRVLSMAEDDQGGIIATYYEHILYKDAKSTSFKEITHRIPYDFSEAGYLITSLIDHNGDLWIGSALGGIIKINWHQQYHELQQSDITHLVYDAEDPASINSNIIQYIYQSSDRLIWVATDGGFCKMTTDGHVIKRYTRSEGLIDDKLLGIIEDDFGRLWCSTISHGLLSFDPAEEDFVYYQERDGIYHNAFLLHSIHKDGQGHILCGNERGLQVFQPKEIYEQIFGGIKPILTGISINNVEIVPEPDGVITVAPELTTSISLAHHQNDIMLRYGLPAYSQTHKYRYAYRLSGGNDTWTQVSDLGRLSFAHLSSGSYLLEISACYANECTYSDPLEIIIATPWWRSIWTALTLGLIGILVVRGLLRRQERRRRIQLEMEKQEAVRETQARFFTNMTHELRTPLTLISGPVDRLMEQPAMQEPGTQHLLKSIQTNANHILQLVNNLLDISKIESGMMEVVNSKTHAKSYFATIADSFQPELRRREITLIPEYDLGHEYMLFDKEKVRIILINVLANAIKFSRDQSIIHLDVSTQGQQLQLAVTDHGIGMTREEQSHIFDRFYSGKETEIKGSGIGMALAREVVDLLGGSIDIWSEQEMGTRITVSLPVEILESDDMPVEQTSVYQPDTSLSSDKPMILIVEDHPEVASFISSGLSAHYKVLTAADGQQGIEMAIEHLPDVILTDVMMPLMNGYTMCQQLRGHILTDHIPIVMLTARADQESRMRGREVGVNGFLTKPYNDQELQLTIQNILTSRDRILEKGKQEVEPKLPDEPTSPFVAKINGVIGELIDEDALTIPRLCETLLISRSQLHRKLKAETGLTTTTYLNHRKLAHALGLLKNPELSIAEIAYQSGFNYPSYFSQLFVQIYGQSPGVYRAQYGSTPSIEKNTAYNTSAQEQHEDTVECKTVVVDQSSTFSNNELPFIKRVEQCIHQNMANEDFSIADLCQCVHLERSQLYRNIKSETGKTPTDLIREIRMRHARQLIRDHHLPLKEVAARCGYKEVSYFSRVYKQVYGYPPSKETK